MSAEPTDLDLLRSFSRRGEQTAFAQLVRRYLNLVFGTALRKTGDAGSAEEISQNVFAALARKSWRFAADDSVPAWLHRAAILESKAWLRGKIRRQNRERIAIELETTMQTSTDDPTWRNLMPLLDEGLLSLREKDRTALLLRFHEKRSLREVGAILGINDDAAQKRIATAVDRLAHFFQRRGFKTVTGAVAAAGLQQAAVSAPASVASAMTQAALSMPTPALSGLTAWLAKGAGLTKVQTIAFCAFLGLGSTGWQWRQLHELREVNAATVMASSEIVARREQEYIALARLQGESARLAMKESIESQLTEIDNRWPDESPYVRVPKRIIRQLDLEGRFSPAGTISNEFAEALALTSRERRNVEEILADYRRSMDSLMADRAYETNAPPQPRDRIAKTIVVPPLGQDLKTLAANTSARLQSVIGAEREELLFGDWAKGGIQVFRPGNLWMIADQAQQMTVWIDVSSVNEEPARYGSAWTCQRGGTRRESGLALPDPIVKRHFAPWMNRHGVKPVHP